MTSSISSLHRDFFSELPYECIECICSFCDERAYNRLVLLNKQIREIARLSRRQLSILVKYLIPEQHPLIYPSIERLVTIYPNITRLHLDLGFSESLSEKQIKDLSRRLTQLEFLFSRDFIYWLGNCPNLKTVRGYLGNITKEQVRANIQIPLKVEDLYLTRFVDITEESVIHLIQNSPKLKRLYICDFDFGKGFLMELIKSCKELTFLSIYNCNLLDITVENLEIFISLFNAKLFLNIDYSGHSSISEEELKALTMRNSNISSNAFRGLLKDWRDRHEI